MTKSKKKTFQKKIRSIDAIQSIAVPSSSIVVDADIPYETRLGLVCIAVKGFVQRTPENLKLGASRVGRSGRRMLGKVAAKLPRITVPQLRVSNRLRSVVASTSLVIMMVLMFFNMGIMNVARAFEDLSQSDWSGGIGTSPVDQYSAGDNVVTTTPNKIQLGATQNSQWCNTANCDSQWDYRKKLLLSPYSEDLSSVSWVNYEFDVTYSAAMKSDFSDLRFVNAAGDADISHLVTRSTNSSSARVIIRMPVVSGVVGDTIYMYYGNGTASSVSNNATTLDVYDSFAANDPCTANICIGGNTLIGNGEMQFTSTSTGFGGSHGPFDRSVTRVYQLDVQPEFTNLTCGQDSDLGGFGINNSGPGDVQMFMYKPSQCNAGQKFGYVSGVKNTEGTYYPTQAMNPPTFADQIWSTLRIVAYASGGEDYFYSSDGGATFQQLNFGQQRTTSMGATRLYAFNGDSLTKVRNIRGYTMNTNATDPIVGLEEKQGGYTGTLESVEYDLGSNSVYFGNISATTSGDGELHFVVMGSANQGGTSQYGDGRNCGFIEEGGQINQSRCIEANSRYIKYVAYLRDNDGTKDLEVTSIGVQYDYDSEAPTSVSNVVAKRGGPSGATVASGWVNTSAYFSWNAAADNTGGSGVAGYCLYFGTDNAASLSTTAGVLGQGGDTVIPGCQHAVSGTSITVPSSALTNGTTYYLKVVPKDYVGNAAQATTYQIGYDNALPLGGTVTNGPQGTVNTPLITASWLATPPAGYFDAESGFAGVKYCAFNYNNPTSLEECGWTYSSGFNISTVDPDRIVGPNRSGLYDTDDVYDFSAGGITLSADDLPYLTDEGINGVVILAIDLAGNFTLVGTGAPVIYPVTQLPPSVPQNLAVTPTSSNDNAYSFTWNAPATITGPSGQVDYCWTVNVSIAPDASNCNWTGQGITQLAQGAYATQQGVNTLYLMAKDQSQNFSNANVASVSFTATTTAPGVPQNLELSDVSIRASESWKIAMSWSAPQLPGSGVVSYKIYRSANNVSFTEVGSTSSTNLSFIDSGLSQTDYYYYVKACDSANSCSVPSNSETMYPDGRYTVPARLTDDTDQPKIRDIGTRKATIYWFTDRASDSKVAYGTAPGQYFPEEVGNSNQLTNHVVNLTNLQPGTRYYYSARWTDEDGNTGTSEERSFVTLPAPNTREVNATDITVSSANINFTTENASKALIYYGTTDAFGGVKSINTAIIPSGYNVGLTDLQDGQKYFYKISTVDADGYEYQGDIYSFTTPARPRITNLRFETVEGEPSSTQKVVWTTNVATTSEVAYGPVDGEQAEAVSSTLVTEHEMVIRGLEDNADYELVARSRDAAGNLAVSDRQFFQTAEDTRAPKITEFKVDTDIRGTGTEARGQIIVSWRTDEPASSQVAFAKGRTTELGNRSSQDTRLTTEHVVVVSDLTTSSIYQVQAVSADKAGNESFSDTQTAIIGRGTENIFSIIFNALQAIFGFGDTSL